MEETATSYLGEEKIGRLMLKFSVPCIMSLLIAALYNMVDQIFIGWGVGYLGNGATNVVYPLTVIALAIALLIGDGCAARLSLCQGRGDSGHAHKSVGNLITLSLVLGIGLMIIFLIFNEKLMWLFGATENNIGFARDYFRYIVFGIPFFVFGNALNGTIRADGSPKFAMGISLVGCIMNVILDPIAIFVLHWGMEGAALATIAGQIATAILTALYLSRMKSVKLRKSSFRIKGDVLRKMIPLGATSFLTQASIVIIMTVMNNTLVRYGAESKYGADIPLTVFGIVMKVFGLVTSIVVGVTVGSQPIVGYNCGAGKIGRVKELFKKLMIVESIVGVVSMICFECFPRQIISIFGSGDELYMEFAALSFRIFLGTILLCVIQKSVSIFLQSLGKPGTSTLLSLLREIIISVPAILLLAKFFGVVGPLWSAPIADVITFVLAIIFARRTLRQLEDAAKQENNVSEENSVCVTEGFHHR